MINKDVYLQFLVDTFDDPDDVVALLNDPAVMRKFTDEDREWLTCKHLEYLGWTEITQEEADNLELIEDKPNVD